MKMKCMAFICMISVGEGDWEKSREKWMHIYGYMGLRTWIRDVLEWEERNVEEANVIYRDSDVCSTSYQCYGNAFIPFLLWVLLILS